MTKSPGNAILARAAVTAVTNPNIETRSGMCSRFCRQVVQPLYGQEIDRLFGASAIETARNFQHRGHTLDPRSNTPRPGDLLFKTQAGRFGHVGIYVGARGVAENASTARGRVQGAKGYRTLEEYGKYNLIGRLPSPPKA
jgi:hypothetical protein